jgi:putative serine protease PepD
MPEYGRSSSNFGTPGPGTAAAPPPPPPAPVSSVVTSEAVPPPHRSKRRGLLLGALACLVAAALAVGITKAVESDDNGGGVSAPPATTAPTTTTVTPTAASSGSTASPIPIGNTSTGLDVTAIVNQVRPSVVKVAVDIRGGGQGVGEGVGTGVILTSDGEILTNAHVVADASQVRVVLDGETDPIPAKVLGTDVGNDLALIKVDQTGLPTMSVADSTKVQVGQPVIAMGYALDLEGDISVTSGIISALDRSMVTENGALDGLLQTDAAISSGNSGGPLINANGEMIGINTAVATGDTFNTATNIGFAISTKEINRILPRLKSGDATPDQGYLGIGVRDRDDGGRGAIVTQVEPDSPADKVGLRGDDVITKVNGVAINGQAGLIAAIRDSAPGDKVTIEFTRNGEKKSGEATLVARPPGG